MIKLLAVVLAAGGLAAGLVSTLLNDHSYTLTGYFLSAEGVVAGNDVVVGGAVVGSVKEVSLASGDGGGQAGARIVMRIDEKAAPLRRGTTALIRQKGVLGNMFVQLTPGAPSAAPIPSGGVLPIEDTAAPVDLDQVMDLFDPQTTAEIRTLTREGGASLQGRGNDLNLLLSALPGITQDTADVTGKLAQQDRQLSALDVEFDRIAAMMASEDRSLRADLSHGAAVLDTMAEHDQQLRDELTSADGTLGALAGGLHGHEGDLNLLLKRMPALLRQLQALSDHSATSLSIVGPCVTDIRETLGEMASADAYRDANGDMLRVHPYLGSERVSTTPIACGGG
jgi:phospholipid/cholesterol/gamma-HCH transport system substrate-binding protein